MEVWCRRSNNITMIVLEHCSVFIRITVFNLTYTVENPIMLAMFVMKFEGKKLFEDTLIMIILLLTPVLCCSNLLN